MLLQQLIIAIGPQNFFLLPWTLRRRMILFSIPLSRLPYCISVSR